MWTVFALALTMALFLFVCEWCISASAAGLCHEELASLPWRRVGLVPGTSRYVHGRINLHYLYRIEAAFAIYNAGKIDYLLVSGDNSTSEYDEPSDMKNDLVARGVPANRIYRDYAGFRTLDSVVRAKAVFGEAVFTVISQKFHNERAIFLARHHGIDAIAFNAGEVSLAHDVKTVIRERLARMKAVIDVWLLAAKPKYLGDRIIIGTTPPT